MDTPVSSNFYSDGAKRMVAEGMEVVSKIMAFIKANETTLAKLEPVPRKKAILEFEPSKQFNPVHPVVFQYLALEGVFNAVAFRRYVISVFGKPKSKEDEAKMRTDRRYVYHFKNAQQSLYYKYLLIETNPSVNKRKIHEMYEEMVSKLNADTDQMLEAYEKAQEDSKVVDAQMTDEKRKELVDLLKKRMSSNLYKS